MAWITNAIDNEHIQLYEFSEFDGVNFHGEGSGEGRFSKVSRADWPCNNRQVALKKMKYYEVKKLVIEVKLHSSSHSSEHVIRFLGLTQEIQDGPYMMVMEYAKHSLRNFLQKGKVSWKVIIKISQDIAKGLLYLHTRGIAHRDLHSNNIVINQVHQCREPDYIAKIIDFGGAKLMSDTEDDIAGVLGQIPFTDPKYLNDRKGYKKDTRSDIYSLGVIFWEISSRKIPFENYMSDSRGDYRELCLSVELISGTREKPVPYTLKDYSSLYKDCWKDEPSERPTVEQIIKLLGKIDPESEDVLPLKGGDQ